MTAVSSGATRQHHPPTKCPQPSYIVPVCPHPCQKNSCCLFSAWVVLTGPHRTLRELGTCSVFMLSWERSVH